MNIDEFVGRCQTKRFGALPIMAVGVALNFVCIAIALSGVELHQFVIALFVLGVGWNFLFTGSTTLSLKAYRPEEKDQAQAAINFSVFGVMAVTSFASGALVTTQGWRLLNLGSLVPVALTAAYETDPRQLEYINLLAARFLEAPP